MSGTLTTSDKHPWAKLPGESAKAYRAFELFRKLPTPRVAEYAWDAYKAERKIKSARPSAAWRGWKTEHDWEARAAAFDARELERANPEAADAIALARQRIIDALPTLIDRAIELATDPVEPDGAMLRDLLDRAGLVKPIKKTNAGNLTVSADAAQFNFNFDNMNTADIQTMIASLKE